MLIYFQKFKYLHKLYLQLIRPMECLCLYFSRDIKVGSLCSVSEHILFLVLWSSQNIEVKIIPGCHCDEGGSNLPLHFYHFTSYINRMLLRQCQDSWGRKCGQ